MFSNLPNHLAIIMDGNGRWATSKGKSRSEGHEAGSETIDQLMDSALEIGLKNVSLYAFSTENWKRPLKEIQAIFSLLDDFIDKKLSTIHSRGIRILHSGSKSKIPGKSTSQIDKAVRLTENNTRLNLNFCLNYGGQEEILNAFDRVIEKRIEEKQSPGKKLSQKEFEENLYTYPLPPVDLLIRTAGEQRVSNFLLWQIAYAELYFTETLWPDFNRSELIQALEWYEKRIRKFGGL
ncbi:MAG: isoprenyl transferase [Leptospiraceae bacterium]|nr:isoprenyl transferase [Leptospiraceae bacterium]MCP5513458.1 isoprenyl transferase [Leptospiraceae bacterium]